MKSMFWEQNRACNKIVYMCECACVSERGSEMAPVLAHTQKRGTINDWGEDKGLVKAEENAIRIHLHPLSELGLPLFSVLNPL